MTSKPKPCYFSLDCAFDTSQKELFDFLFNLHVYFSAI